MALPIELAQAGRRAQALALSQDSTLNAAALSVDSWLARVTQSADRDSAQQNSEQRALLARSGAAVAVSLLAAILLAGLLWRETRRLSAGRSALEQDAEETALAAQARERLLTDELAERRRAIEAAAKHLLSVLNDVLDLSKVESGKLVLEDIDFLRDELVSQAFEMVTVTAAEKGVELVFDTCGVPDRMRGDPQRLGQALINLLANAVKFTERGWVRLQSEVLKVEPGRLLLRFEVRDTGIGIPADRHGALFNAFEQADSSTTRRHGATWSGSESAS